MVPLAPAPAPALAPASAAAAPERGLSQEMPPLGAMLAQQCAAVVAQYGLSAREADVLGLLARGRDAAYIADELVISKNTVRTHMRNIFSKTGVHSRQELIDLVETAERS